MTETYTGTIDKVIYRNDDFLIAKFSSGGNDITITGSIFGVSQGEKITINGKWANHSKYGKQFSVDHWERPMPETEEQAIAFLASPLIKGCGEKRARQIVKRLGKNALQRIADERTDCLIPIRGIGKKKAQKIVDSVSLTFEVQNIISELLVFGITASMAMKLYKEYGPEAARVVKENPYKLTELNLVAFLKADDIARKIGITPLSGYRIDACVQFVLKEKCFSSGHCYLPEDELIEETLKVLNHHAEKKVTRQEIEQSIGNLEETRLVIEDGCVYPKFLYNKEEQLSWKLVKMRGATRGEAVSSAILDGLIRDYQKEHRIVLADKQREAIRRLLEENLLILTGNPGTGKTTVIRAMLEIYKKQHPDDEIALCAPTGRASRKLAEITERPASTIHRLIDYRPGNEPGHNRDNPLPANLVIVDEMSMVDLQVAALLMDAIDRNAKVLFVGDTDQLPSVNPGNVLHDLLEAEVPHVKLTDIFRQAQESQIITNAHRINQGKSLLVDENKSDFYFIQKEDPKIIAKMLVKSAVRFTELGYTIEDILVLSPMKKGPIGTEALNQTLQNQLNPALPSKKEWKKRNVVFRQGDKVIQLKNRPNKNIYNGDIGTIRYFTAIKNNDGELTEVMVCDFMGQEVHFEKDELRELQLAYSVTIHKAQGGQAPIVIIPISTSHYIMLARNLIYTGMTRAEEKMVFIGTKKAISIAIHNHKVAKRNTKLAEKITAHLGDASVHQERDLQNAK